MNKLECTDLDRKYLSLCNVDNAIHDIPVSTFDFVIEKPWGYEKVILHNNSNIIWDLHIKENERTSMHCHTLKMTMMIVLNGEVKLHTMTKKPKILKAFDSIVIDLGVFHSIEAISKGGASAVEIDYPPLFLDVVRLEDKYGRAGKPYFPDMEEKK